MPQLCRGQPLAQLLSGPAQPAPRRWTASPPGRSATKSADRHIRLMADGGDDRDLGCVDGAGHALIVEGPEILHGAAAASGDDDIRQLLAGWRSGSPLQSPPGPPPPGPAPAAACTSAQRIALPQDAQHIVDRRARRGRDDGDPVRDTRGSGFLCAGSNSPSAMQLLLELLKGHIADRPRRRASG